MSRDNPEVGDVWIKKINRNNTEILYITSVGVNYISFIGTLEKSKRFFVNSFYKADDDRFDKFTVIYTYMGKSRGYIQNLFEVRDDI